MASSENTVATHFPSLHPVPEVSADRSTDVEVSSSADVFSVSLSTSQAFSCRNRSQNYTIFEFNLASDNKQPSALACANCKSSTHTESSLFLFQS